MKEWIHDLIYKIIKSHLYYFLYGRRRVLDRTAFYIWHRFLIRDYRETFR